MKRIFQITLTYWWKRQLMLTLYDNQLSYTWFTYEAARVWVGNFGHVIPEDKTNPNNWETITRYHCTVAGSVMFPVFVRSI